MSAEQLVPEGLVNEYLGVKRTPRNIGVNIVTLNALGDRWINRGDLLQWLQLNVHATGSDLLDKVLRELEEVTQGED